MAGRARRTIKSLAFLPLRSFLYHLAKGLFSAVEVVMHVGQGFHKKCVQYQFTDALRARQRLD